MSWKAEVIADRSGKWCSNALRFATQAEAEAYVADLAWRWTSVCDTRATECPNEPATVGVAYDREGYWLRDLKVNDEAEED